MPNDASSVLSVARGEIGYSRWADPQPGTKYGREYALAHGSYYGTSGVPYCAMFVTWVFAHAGATCPGLPSAYCPHIARDARAAGAAVGASQAQPGDLVIFDWGGDGEADHVGIVESNDGSRLTTIEGNTSSGAGGSQSNGGVVARRSRGYGVVQCCVRPSWGPSAGWVKAEDGRWWYRHADGSWTSGGWERVDGRWYLFDGQGWMLTGWQRHDGQWYLLGDDGAMLTGWQRVSGRWYYLTDTGAMATGWQMVDGTWYYTDPDTGEMVTGWRQVDGSWYWMDPATGAMASSTAVVQGSTVYVLDASGRDVAAVDLTVRPQ